jgi:hypothetical protein
VCAPAIVRATSLTPLHVFSEAFEPLHAGFVQRLFYAPLASRLRTGRMSTVINDGIVAEADALRLVLHARRRDGSAAFPLARNEFICAVPLRRRLTRRPRPSGFANLVEG